MKNRFHVPDALKSGTTIALDAEERHHARVLRVREGEEVEVFDALGKNYLARFESPEAVHVLNETGNREPATTLHLAMSIIQLEKFEFVLQKGTELGVRSFIPLITDRIEVRVERIRGKEDRWKKIVLEAVKQSGRSQIPEIEPPTQFDDAIARAGTKLVFDADAETTTRQPDNPTTLFIGPEGGFSERELQLARESGAAFERLGPRRLRAETAAIVALTLVAARSGDI
ncbi:MAG: 16S rRNA (uracil(1498)-N(3))-methyltransferase [Acidobacteriota bacterium]|nr:16S rRNA (uracil(1498)-N(3))-methyltransferase [Acidobacteriota bacterium]